MPQYQLDDCEIDTYLGKLRLVEKRFVVGDRRFEDLPSVDRVDLTEDMMDYASLVLKMESHFAEVISNASEKLEQFIAFTLPPPKDTKK